MPRVSFDRLSPTEQILHVQELWDRIARRAADVELTDGQRAELDRRLAEHRAGKGRLIPWPEVRRYLRRGR